MDEELSLEIAKSKSENNNNDLVITILFTRTYVFTDTEEVHPINGNPINTDALSEYHALVM
jgi:hypothetical protein